MMTPSAIDVQHEPEPEIGGLTRREIVRAGGILGASAAIGGTLLVRAKTRDVVRDPTGEGTVRHLTVLSNIPAQPQEDLLLRMQRELVKAMAKPVEQRRWMMVIDTRKCVGCHACTIACVAENHLPPGVVYRPVVTEEFGEFPNVQLRFTPRPCMQCEMPPLHAGLPRERDVEAAGRNRGHRLRQVHRLRVLHHRLPLQRANARPRRVLHAGRGRRRPRRFAARDAGAVGTPAQP